MLDQVRTTLVTQYEASLSMLRDCVDKCPPEHWEGLIAKYAFWNVAYHTLCFVDLYLSPEEAAWTPREIHPLGMKELDNEFPSRLFDRTELLEYIEFCRGKARESVPRETEATLAGPSGFKWYKVTRLEMHLINIRHIQHHTGALSAFLRKIQAEPRWVGSGWK